MLKRKLYKYVNKDNFHRYGVSFVISLLLATCVAAASFGIVYFLN